VIARSCGATVHVSGDGTACVRNFKWILYVGFLFLFLWGGFIVLVFWYYHWLKSRMARGHPLAGPMEFLLAACARFSMELYAAVI
jgi:hypothetical protein